MGKILTVLVGALGGTLLALLLVSAYFGGGIGAIPGGGIVDNAILGKFIALLYWLLVIAFTLILVLWGLRLYFAVRNRNQPPVQTQWDGALNRDRKPPDIDPNRLAQMNAWRALQQRRRDYLSREHRDSSVRVGVKDGGLIAEHATSAEGSAALSSSQEDQLTAVYYPYSRCTNEETLKRALLLYDRIVFVDPKTPKVRQGLYSVQNHQAYLPDDAAQRLAWEWDHIEQHYNLLMKEEVVSYLDPTALTERPTVDQLMTNHLQSDMGDDRVLQLFDTYPDRWSMLRSRIPKSSFKYLNHQYTWRVLNSGNTKRPFQSFGENEHYALFADGKPDQDYTLPRWIQPEYDVMGSLPEVEEEYASVVPYYIGSSFAVSLMLAVSSDTGAIPFTDSDAHHKLLSIRYQRAAIARASDVFSEIPGLTQKEQPGLVQKRRMVEMRLMDSVLSSEDLQSLSLEECIEYRKHTQQQRQAFVTLLSDLTNRTKNAAWSPEIEQELRDEIREIHEAIEEQKNSLHTAYRELFQKAAIGVTVSTAPVLLNTVFPGISVPVLFILGAGTGSGLLAEPIKELAVLWAKNLNQQNALAYLLDLKQ